MIRRIALGLTLLSFMALADTPPPGTVKAKTWTGDGVTSITSSGPSGALDVNVRNTLTITNTANGSTGSAVPTVATQVGGSDGVNLRALKVSSTGVLAVDGSAVTQPVSAASLPLPSGAATAANQSLVTGSAGGGSAAGSSLLTGGIYNSTPPTLTNGQQSSLQFDSSGNLKTAGTSTISGTVAATQSGTWTVQQGSAPWSVSQSGTWNVNNISGTISLPTGAATDASVTALQVSQGSTTSGQKGNLVQGAVTTSAPTYTTAQTSPLSLTTGGSLRVLENNSSTINSNISSIGSQLSSVTATPGAVPPGLGFYSASLVNSAAPVYTDNRAEPLSMTTAGALRMDGSAVTQPVSGTFWQATQPVSGTVTANAGTGTFTVSGTVTANAGTNLNTSALALDTSVNGILLSQGSTTSGQSGPILQGAVTTSAPTYITAKTDPLSLTTSGALRVDLGATSANSTALKVDGSAVTQPVSIATLPALTAGSAIIGNVRIDQTTPGTTNGVQVTAAIPAGSNVIGHVIADSGSTTVVTGTVGVTQSGTWTVQPGNTANTTAWLVSSQPKTPTALTVKSAAVTIGTTAVRLTNDGLAPAATRVLLIAQLLSTSTANCFMGPSSVTSSGTTRGIQMFAGQSFSFNNDAGDYYAICDASSQTFFITEQE